MLFDPAFVESVSGTEKYGPLANLVQNAGFLLAAVFALSLGWMRRSGSSWAPPEEAVSKGTTRVASLVTAVLLSVMFVFLRTPDHIEILAVVTVLSLIVAVVSLLVTTYLIKRFGIETTRPRLRGKPKRAIVLGGSELTAEATMIRENKSIPTLYQESNHQLHLIFTDSSIAYVHTGATASFVFFQAFGSLALAGAGLLLSI